MKQCWICSKFFERLSKEHIIPHLFEGYVTTEEFSCAECNSNLGKYEQCLSQISIMMQNLDNAKGEPTNVIPKGESPKKERKWLYGDKPGIELSTSGRVRGDGWERPPGEVASDDKIWLPGRIDMPATEQDVHKSMVKAIMALACHVGFPRRLLEVPLSYLAGNDNDLAFMQPTSLGIPSRGMFARVWIFAPPTTDSMTIYGAVAYGPLSNIYRLITTETSFPAFCFELRAYSRHELRYEDTTSYMNWRSTLLEEFMRPSEYRHIGHEGIFNMRESRRSGLVVLEASPSGAERRSLGIPELHIRPHPLAQTHGPSNRFENWVKSIISEEEHTRFLIDAREVDDWLKGSSNS